MAYSSAQHHRRSIRLPGYDYAQSGGYFITICTHERRHLFGKISNKEMIVNDYGQIVNQCWLEIPQHFPHASLDAFVIMPNHLHGIVVLDNTVVNLKTTHSKTQHTHVGAKNFSPQRFSPQPNRKFRSPSQAIGSIVRGFKIGVMKWFREHTEIYTVW
jgi:REP element-mobilizing transposase RayT